MTRVHEVIRRYEGCRSVLRYGVTIFAVGDPEGAALNAAVRNALFALGDQRSHIWDELLQVASTLRWRRMTQPQPNKYQPEVAQLAEQVRQEAQRLRHVVSNEEILDRLAAAAAAVAETDSFVGDVLLESIKEVGPKSCAVVASRRVARAGIASWLDFIGVQTLVPTQLGEIPTAVDLAYVVAPPTFVPASIVTAPTTREVTFVMPAWFRNRALPTSSLGPHAEGAMVIKTRVHEVGVVVEAPDEVPAEAAVEDNYFPQPIWGARTSGDREPESDEIEARKILLGGGLALWLDDGERIRTLHPGQPAGDRVGYDPVSNVGPGTYLVLRERETERGAMYDQALRDLGAGAAGVLATQERWKRALARRLAARGLSRAVTELAANGVRSAGQVRAWMDPRLICPQRDADFVGLLEWLQEPLHPTQSNAIMLRRGLYRASAKLRKALEAAVDTIDLSVLERDGFLRVALAQDGFHGMIVARVLACAPFTEIVSRHEVRVPFQEVSPQWLE